MERCGGEGRGSWANVRERREDGANPHHPPSAPPELGLWGIWRGAALNPPGNQVLYWTKVPCCQRGTARPAAAEPSPPLPSPPPPHLCKLREAAAGVAAGGDEHLGVDLPRVRVLVVDVRAGHGRVVILQLDFIAQLGLLVAQLGGDGLALCTAGVCMMRCFQGRIVLVAAPSAPHGAPCALGCVCVPQAGRVRPPHACVRPLAGNGCTQGSRRTHLQVLVLSSVSARMMPGPCLPSCHWGSRTHSAG